MKVSSVQAKPSPVASAAVNKPVDQPVDLPVDLPGGPTLRQQFRTREKAFAEQEKLKLDATKTPEQRAALKKKFTEARAARARQYAAMLCSEEGWAPKPGAKAEGRVLTAFYQRLGQRGREIAAREGKPFTLEALERVRLSKADVEALRKEFGDDEVKKALPLLKKHIMHESFLDRAAMKFMGSSEFATYQAAIAIAVDKMERGIQTHREKLDEKSAESLRDHHKTLKKRRLSRWTEQVVVHKSVKADGSKLKTSYAAVGGRLIPIDTKREP
jgi:hypothetical protein